MALNYIGSKLSLLKFIHFVVDRETKNDISVVGDLFAGTGVVGQSFKRKGYKIVANDIQYYSYVMNRKFLGVNGFLDFTGLTHDIPRLADYEKKEKILFVLDHLNNLTDQKKGFIFNNYSPGGTAEQEFERLYFSDENAIKIDTIRMKIGSWLKDKKITEDEYFYLLGTLIEASDKVANTASVYGAFLKKIKPSARKKLRLEYNEIIPGTKENVVFNDDILNILNNERIDLLYLDPPYNLRQYCSNYHLLETIAKYDEPEISGKTGLREYSKQRSAFCIKRKVKEEFRKVVEGTNAKYILLSYNNEGLMSIKDVHEVLSLRGDPKTFKFKYRRFKADKTENRNHKFDSTYEYLHFVKCERRGSEVRSEDYPIIEVYEEMMKGQTN